MANEQINSAQEEGPAQFLKSLVENSNEKCIHAFLHSFSYQKKKRVQFFIGTHVRQAGLWYLLVQRTYARTSIMFVFIHVHVAIDSYVCLRRTRATRHRVNGIT